MQLADTGLRPDSAQPDLAAALAQGHDILSRAWPEGHAARQTIATLAQRLASMRLRVAVLGQFKRGKSTFINALLGKTVVPSAVVPATAVPTFISWFPRTLIRVAYLDGRPEQEIVPGQGDDVLVHMKELVTEVGNPHNRRAIARVDLLTDADVLKDGLVLIDTPGIGSTLQHNTHTALQVLPECDAALFLFSADPPLTQAEISYLSTVQANVSRLFFILNKVDYLTEQERAELTNFAQGVLEDSGFTPAPRILLLSARQALSARMDGDRDALEASGLLRIEREIFAPLEAEKTIALTESVQAKAGAALDRAIADLRLRVRSLELPIEDLESRARALDQSLDAIRAEQIASKDSLEGDRRRTVAELERQAEALRQDANAHLHEVVQRSVGRSDGAIDRAAIQRELDQAIPAFFDSQLEQTAAAFRALVQSVLSRHQERADRLIDSIHQIAATLFDVPFHPAEAADPFRLGPEPYWLSRQLPNVLIPAPTGLLTPLLSAKRRHARLQAELDEQIASLVRQNVENLRWSTLRGLNDTFRRFSAQLEARLNDALLLTQGAVQQALDRRRRQAGQSDLELQTVRAMESELAALRDAVTGQRKAA